MKQFTGTLSKEEFRRKQQKYLIETIDMHLKREFSKTLVDIQVEDKEVDESIKHIKTEFEKQPGLKGRSFEEILAFQGLSIDDIRERQKNNIRYLKYIEGLVREEDCRKEFEERKYFYDGTQVRISEIVCMRNDTKNDTALEKARMISAILSTPGSEYSFRDLAELFSETPQRKKGGDIGFIFRLTTKIPEEVVSAAFSLKPGEVSGIIKTFVGYHLVKVTDRKEGTLKTYEECRPNIRTFLVYKKEHELLEKLRKKANIVFPEPEDRSQKTDGSEQNQDGNSEKQKQDNKPESRE